MRVVADLDRQADLDLPVAIRVIEHGRGHQGLVGHDRLDAVKAAHDDIARGDFADHAEAVVDGDHVADADRAIEQYGEAGDVVAGELLQAKADTHADSAAKHSKHRPLE